VAVVVQVLEDLVELQDQAVVVEVENIKMK
jgi:hypothetical protein